MLMLPLAQQVWRCVRVVRPGSTVTRALRRRRRTHRSLRPRGRHLPRGSRTTAPRLPSQLWPRPWGLLPRILCSPITSRGARASPSWGVVRDNTPKPWPWKRFWKQRRSQRPRPAGKVRLLFEFERSATIKMASQNVHGVHVSALSWAKHKHHEVARSHSNKVLGLFSCTYMNLLSVLGLFCELQPYLFFNWERKNGRPNFLSRPNKIETGSCAFAAENFVIILVGGIISRFLRKKLYAITSGLKIVYPTQKSRNRRHCRLRNKTCLCVNPVLTHKNKSERLTKHGYEACNLSNRLGNVSQGWHIQVAWNFVWWKSSNRTTCHYKNISAKVF